MGKRRALGPPVLTPTEAALGATPGMIGSHKHLTAEMRAHLHDIGVAAEFVKGVEVWDSVPRVTWYHLTTGDLVRSGVTGIVLQSTARFAAVEHPYGTVREAVESSVLNYLT